MLVILENALIEMGNAPAQRDVVVEELGELGGSLTGIGVTLGAERYEDLLLLVECHIAVHHGGEADGGQ